jgi:Protein of unknown function (DUF3575)
MIKPALFTLAVPAALVLAATSPAAAQSMSPGPVQTAVPPPPPQEAPPPPPPAQAAVAQPSGAPGNDVSHIGGTPVPVGDHNQYHYRFRRTNLSTNPIGWVLGIYGASLSYGFSDHIAVRGDLNYFDFLNDDGHGYEIGVGLPIYFRRTYSGVFLEPGFILRQYGEDEDYDDNTTMGPQVLVGWHWMWDSGLNLAIAAGIGRNWSREDSPDSDFDDEEPFFNGYLRFGYAF